MQPSPPQPAPSHLAELLAALPHAVWLTDRAGVVTWANEAFALSVGVPLETALGQPLERLLPPELAERHAEQARAVLAAGQPVSFALGQSVDGVQSEQSVLRVPLSDETGAVVALAACAIDVTRELLARRQQHELCARVRLLQDQITRLVG
ncbi:MAG: PAS domain-containing protein [Planctomycetota bacterium]